MTVGIHLACDVCTEELLVALPLGRTRRGIFDCPSCGSTYLFSPDASEESIRRAVVAAD